jgi:hypothetical protein
MSNQESTHQVVDPLINKWIDKSLGVEAVNKGISQRPSDAHHVQVPSGGYFCTRTHCQSPRKTWPLFVKSVSGISGVSWL